MVLSWSDGVWHHLCFLKGKVSYLHSNDACAYQGNESRGIVSIGERGLESEQAPAHV